jgi:hypothetical protein
VAWRKTLNVFEDRRRVILIHAKQQIVADRNLIQCVRVTAQLIQRATEFEVTRDVSVEERLDAEVIARAEETLLSFVPDRKRKVADEVFDAVFAPRFVSVED